MFLGSCNSSSGHTELKAIEPTIRRVTVGYLGWRAG